ncbi:MAG: S9 family peptidase, partial [Anaerolineales bacterium]|nr:S9 family peptidase [Anaerolineales bacterium]
LFRILLEDPLTMFPLTEPDPDFFIRGGELHPNERWLVYGANYDFAAEKEIEPTWIYRHDLDTGEREVLARPKKGSYIVPQLSTDGRWILYNRKDLHPAGRQVWVVDIEGDRDREILNFGEDVKVFASLIPNKTQVLFLVETPTHRKLGIYELKEDKVKWLVDDPERNIEQAFVPYGSEQIVILEVHEARTHASLLDPSTGIEIQLTLDEGNLIPLGPLTDHTWVGQFYSSSQPSDICHFSIQQPAYDREASISRVWEQTILTGDDFTQAEDFHWKGADGLPIQGWLYRPESDPKGTIVYVHGGPTAHSQDAINNQIQLFVQNGYNVLDPNYRGSTGFGVAFKEEIKKDGWGGMEQEDIRRGIEALIEKGIADEGKVGITGTSYGGYSSWYAITRFPLEVLAAAAPVCGMTDLVVDYESTRPDLRPYSEEMMGGSPEDVPEKYHDRSPINFVSEIQGNLLIVQGDRDPNVTPENVRVVRDALDQAGVSYENLRFADEGHGISRPKNQKILYKELLNFFDRSFGKIRG